MDVLETHRHFFRDAKRPAQIQLAFHLDANLLEWNSHGRGDQLTGELRTRGECSEEKITGAGSGAGSTDTAVRLRFEDLLTYLHRTCDWVTGLVTLCSQRDA